MRAKNVHHKGHVKLVMMPVCLLFLTVPGAAVHIVLSASSSSLLTVEWGAPSGGVKGYTVTLEGDDGDHPAEARDESTRSATFNGLSAGTEYTFGVVTLSGDQQSAKVQHKFSTIRKCYSDNQWRLWCILKQRSDEV